MGAIIWQKKTTSNTTGGASLMGSYPFPKNGIISIDYEFILLFKKLGSTQKPDKERKELSRLTKEEWREYFSGHWSFGGAKQNNHIAMFPEELPKRLIKMFSFVGDNILDPFTGSGTTSLAAQKLNRNSFGYEINPDFIPIIKNKLNINQKSIFYSPTYKFISPPQKTTNFQQKINKLPYTYKDTNSFDKKVDPHKLKFGSKIKQNDDNKNDNLYSIKEIITPTIFRLSNNIIVKLIGVKEKKETTKNAIEFLKLKTAKQKVFFKYDDIKYDKENNLMVYLYLKNKTFINAHLIKNGFAVALKNIEYKNKNKFIKLEERHAKQLT
jgi:site-specific DNA-methyltransferase (adenine-specific)